MNPFSLRPISEQMVSPFFKNEENGSDALYQAVVLFYAGDFTTAGRHLDDLMLADPSDVRPAFFNALIPFLHFYFEDPVNKRHYESFKTRFQQFPKKSAGDGLGFLMTAGLYGYASLAALKADDPLNAARFGLEGWDYLKKIPEEADSGYSLIGRGLTSFLAGSAPFPVRISFVVQGVHASREEGIRLVRKAAALQSIVSADALLILTQLYPMVGETGMARYAAEALSTAYPGNAIYRQVLASLR